MAIVGKLLILCTICFSNIDAKHIPKRGKRFVLQSDILTNKASFPTPTTFPVPLPHQNNTAGLANGQQQCLTGVDLLQSYVVKCPIKRSATVRRVLLDDRLMQELYLALFGNIDEAAVAGNPNDVETTFRQTLISHVNKTHRRHHHNKNIKKSVFVSDLNKYHAWYNSVLEDIQDRENATNNTVVRTIEPTNSVEAILSKVGLTKAQLKQILGLVNEIDDIKGFRLSNERVKRDTIGAIKSQTEYCNQRGVPTGTGYLHMCSACAMTTQFPDDMFPRYVSEVSCDQSDCDCFTIKNTAHGKCQPMMKNIRMLKRKNDGCRMVIKNGQQIIVDNWELYEQPLHVGCECMFKKNSMFATFIPKR